MSIDLSKLARKELEKLRVDVDKAIRDAETRDRKEAKKAAEKAAAKFGFSLNELAGAAGKGKAGKGTVGAPKYAHPDNSSLTWTGKGRQPKWFKEAVEGGMSLKKLEI